MVIVLIAISYQIEEGGEEDMWASKRQRRDRWKRNEKRDRRPGLSGRVTEGKRYMDTDMDMNT
jgi:hypothetical protein